MASRAPTGSFIVASVKQRMPFLSGLVSIFVASACARGAAPASPTREAHAEPGGEPAGGEPASGEPARAERALDRSSRSGIVVEQIVGPRTERTDGDGRVTLARFDLARYRLTLITEAENEGVWRTLPEWAARDRLAGGINAAMFEPEGRASGLLVDDGLERAPDDPRFGGVLAFDPIDPRDAPFVMVGRDCRGVDLPALRARYRSLVANYRMLDCDGAAIAWVDPSAYSSAAFARDREGRFVLVHAETPYRMRDLAVTLADPALGLTDVHYVEGGPKASAWIDDGTGTPRSLVGSRVEDDGHVERGPRPIPNVLGLVRRDGSARASE